MSRLVPLNYDKVIKTLTKLGYIMIHQKGSHIVMQLADKRKYTSIFREKPRKYDSGSSPQTDR
ncbi:MAG: type II toxin-antitoxin system HicA family toxin [Candidatus Micrarchaeota archaeon]|nr:type II toxin-antitoxin system HicA family toxin [Candidatus Micrarchaeota archaeon]MDE1848256.1 type II toxin-antitoxin system HicA family toxin [Candidatus Micrarchaeota archaeon]MDE1864390.1 type II toxin-antitoxin system HicA family toxin [Candidatus Micrarchaeota archaeon]